MNRGAASGSAAAGSEAPAAPIQRALASRGGSSEGWDGNEQGLVVRFNQGLGFVKGFFFSGKQEAWWGYLYSSRWQGEEEGRGGG